VVSWEGTPHPVNISLNPDPTFATKLEKYAAPVKQLERQVIGETEVMLDAERIAIRTGETNLGNLIADALLAKTRRDGSQVAIVNSGGIRASIPEGEITVAGVLEVLPFGNTVARADLTGAQLKEALEHGVSEVEQGSGRFPQVAGLRFVWNLSAQPGSRIVEVQVADGSDRFEPLDPDAIYRVVTNSFLLNGGDDYSIFQEGKNRLDTGDLMADVVMDYLKASSPINRRVEERIEQVTL
jgi:5'-nucleotidase